MNSTGENVRVVKWESLSSIALSLVLLGCDIPIGSHSDISQISCRKWNIEHAAKSAAASEQNSLVLSDPRIINLHIDDGPNSPIGTIPSNMVIGNVGTACRIHPQGSLDYAIKLAISHIREIWIEKLS